MISIILNEKDYALALLKEDKLGKRPSFDLRILSKYYYYVEELETEEIYHRLVSIMKEKYENFAITNWQELLLKLAENAKKQELTDIAYVPVTKQELLTIQQLNGKPIKRIAFTLLCLAKYKNMQNTKNNGWIHYEYKELFKMANVAATIKEQCKIIHDLKELELIHMNKLVNNLSIQVNFTDANHSEEVLQIKDFRNLGYEYLIYCGEKFFRCQKCRVLERKTSSNNKYCKECSVIIKKERSKESMKSLRKSKMENVPICSANI